MSIKVQHGLSFIPENETTLVVELEEAVNPKKAFIIPCGWDVRIVLKDSKHIKIKRAYPSIYEAEVAWQVVEAVPDKPKRKLYGTVRAK